MVKNFLESLAKGLNKPLCLYKITKPATLQ